VTHAVHEDAEVLELGDVLACSVHDIKNSLGVILGLVDNLSDEMREPTDPLIQAFANLRYEGRRLNTNFVQLLSLYRMEDGAYQVNASEVLVDDFLRECQLMHEDVLETRGITIDTDTPNGIYGCFDWSLVMGVIGTIINNAYRYASARVLLEVLEVDGYLKISVIDDDPGYPNAMLRSDVENVSRVSFKTGSSGLGLYFAAVIEQAHRNKERRGYVGASNDGLGDGGKFSLYLL
jgi:signal transduction histidine kinase